MVSISAGLSSLRQLRGTGSLLLESHVHCRSLGVEVPSDQRMGNADDLRIAFTLARNVGSRLSCPPATC